MAVNKGEKAPGFTLQNTELEHVDLESLRNGGRLVLLFFPLAFSSVCTNELCRIRDSLKEYEALNVNVTAISVDSPFALKAFKEQQNYNFPLLSDFNREVANAYGVLYDDYFGMKGVAKRSAFVIDQDGLIEYAEILEDSGKLPNFERIRQVLK